MSKHTPGPWRTHEDFPCLICDLGLGLIARTDVTTFRADPKQRGEENEANARLIAAAPEMLAALKAVHERRIAWPAEIEAAVVSAIATAEGQ